MPDAEARNIRRFGAGAVARRTYHQVISHRVIDAAAALTFFATLSVLPTALTVVSAISLFDKKGSALDSIIDILGVIVRPDAAAHFARPLRQLTTLQNPELAFAVGSVLTLWSLSGYATAFGRAMNSAYEVQEGRRIWKFRGTMLFVTFIVMLVGGVAIVILLATPTVASAIVNHIGLPPWSAQLWNVAKWPILLVDLIVMVAVLYYATPNVRTPRLRWVSAGAVFAIGTWAIATFGFAVYVETIGAMNRTYGWLGGGILFLAYIYLSNFVLVVGGELDAEVIRMRQLLAGIDADEAIRLPLRDVRRNHTLARWHSADVDAARRVRLASIETVEPLQPVEVANHLRDEASRLQVGEPATPRTGSRQQ